MNNAIYAVACIFFVVSPVFLIVGLIRPQLFAKIIRGKRRRLSVFLYALTVFIVSVTLAGAFEPASVKHDREIRQQLAAQHAKEEAAQKAQAKQQLTKQTPPSPTPKPATTPSKPATTTAPAISALNKTKDGYVITGNGEAGQTVEVRTINNKKYKVTVGSNGTFSTAAIKDLKPYGTLSLFTLEKSFLHTKAQYDQTEYYSLFASQPKLSANRLGAVITGASKDGANFKVQGFYLPKTKLTLVGNNKTLTEAKTNKDGYFVFRSIKPDADTMQLAVDENSKPVASSFVYTPKLSLLAKAPTVKTEQQTKDVPFQSTTTDDNTITKGKTVIATAGHDGVRTLMYQVTYINGQEVARKQLSDVVTTQPVNEVKKVGTYVYVAPPTPAPTPSFSNGATARCRDGTPSYSQNRRGTCSHHGGVAIWY